MTGVAGQVVQHHSVFVGSALASGRHNPVMTHGSTVIEAQFDVRITDIDGKQHMSKLRFSGNQTICCTLLAYCFSRAAIMKGSPNEASVATTTSVLVRVSRNASVVGVRMRLRRWRETDGIKPRPKKKPTKLSLARGISPMAPSLETLRSGGGAPRAVTWRTYMSGTCI